VLRDRRGSGAGAEAGLREEIGGQEESGRMRGEEMTGLGRGLGGRVGTVNSSLRDELSSVEL
jgi:hypothetical protein